MGPTRGAMISRRLFLSGVAGAGLVVGAPRVALSQSYPQHPVKIIVDRPAGVPHDLLARAMAEKLSASFKQTFIVDNRVGAGGNLAAELVPRPAPARCTLQV